MGLLIADLKMKAFLRETKKLTNGSWDLVRAMLLLDPTMIRVKRLLLLKRIETCRKLQRNRMNLNVLFNQVFSQTTTSLPMRKMMAVRMKKTGCSKLLPV